MRKYSLLKIWSTIAVLAILTLACGQFDVGIETRTADDAGGLISSTNADMVDTQTAPTPTAPTSWMSSAEAGTYTVTTELAGLVFRQNESIWVVNENGTPILAASNIYDGKISPDLSKMVYAEPNSGAEDLVLLDLNRGTTQMLTETPTIMERGAQWWPSRPDVLIYNQVPQDQLGPWAGYLGALNLITGETMNLDTMSSSYSGFALSPDGRSILYDDAGAPALFLWGEGISRMDMRGYGVNYDSFSAPAWSPDGKTAAMHAIRQPSEGGASEAAIVLVNLETGQARILHPYRSVGQRGGPELAFSEDGRWLAVVAPGDEDTLGSGPMALWVLAVDGSEEHYLGYGTGPVWNPTGGKLLFTQWPLPGTGGGSFQQDAHIIMVETGGWSLQEITPLLGSNLMSWYELP